MKSVMSPNYQAIFMNDPCLTHFSFVLIKNINTWRLDDKVKDNVTIYLNIIYYMALVWFWNLKDKELLL